MTWIKISDSLPNEYDWVLVMGFLPKADPYYVISIGRYIKKNGWELLNENCAVYHDVAMELFSNEITHWQYFEEPKEIE